MSGPVTLAPVQATSAPARRITLAPLRQAWSRFWLQDWSRLWFQDKSTSPLEIARIGIGAALLLHYGLASPYLFTLWGDDGWVPRALLGDVSATLGSHRSFSTLRRHGSGSPFTRSSCSVAPP